MGPRAVSLRAGAIWRLISEPLIEQALGQVPVLPRRDGRGVGAAALLLGRPNDCVPT